MALYKSFLQMPDTYSVPYIKYITGARGNDTGAVTLNNYTIPETGCYLIAVVCGSSSTGSSGPALDAYYYPTITLNTVEQTYKRIVDDSEEYNNVGYKVDLCIVQATKSDILKVVANGKGKNGVSVAVFVFRFMFDDYKLDNVTLLTKSAMVVNSGVLDYDLDTSTLKGKSCIVFQFVRRNSYGGYNDTLTVKKTGRNNTYTESASGIFNLYNPNDTTWCIRVRGFYPQRYNDAIMNIKTSTVAQHSTAECIVVGF